MINACVTLWLGIAMLAPVDSVEPIASTVAVIPAGEGGGTGVVIDRERRWILTAAHVVGSAKQVELFFPRRDSAGGWLSHRDSYLGDRATLRPLGLVQTATVVRRSSELDLALLECAKIPDGIPAIAMAEAGKIGEPIRLWGNRRDVETFWNETTGTIRQLRMPSEGYWVGREAFAEKSPTMLLQVPALQGDSGGPVVNSRGELVGMFAATAGRAPELGYAIPVGSIRAFLKGKSPSSTTISTDIPATLRMMSAVARVNPLATTDRCAAICIDRAAGIFLTTTAAVGKSDRVTLLLPKIEANSLIADWSAYADHFALASSGNWLAGWVIHRDAKSGVAVVRVAQLPDSVQAIPLADRTLQVGDRISTVQHALGVSVGWLVGRGSIRQRERGGDVGVGRWLVQLPVQSRASGAPILDDSGSLQGILLPMEGIGGSLGYACDTATIRELLRPLASQMNPKNAADWSTIATGHQSIADVPGAILAWNQVLRHDPQSIPARMALANAARSRGDVREFEQLWRSIPESEAKALQWVEWQMTELPPTEFVKLLHRVKTDYPKSERISLLELQWAVREGDRAGWQRLQLQLRERFSNSAEFRAILAQAAASGGVWDSAFADLDIALEQSPTRPDWLALRIEWRIRRSEWKQAIADCRTLLEFNPCDGKTLRRLLPLELRERNDLAAESMSRDWVRLSPQAIREVMTVWQAERIRRRDAGASAWMQAELLNRGMRACRAGLPPDSTIAVGPTGIQSADSERAELWLQRFDRWVEAGDSTPQN
ncbi:S1 family peptidase [Tuwongella immobilis]|uniref:Uncharacterized protein n=1 Tax=Tuwongella immobilis TaxID=692036 RepID=A0A6C2YNU4_9BACT|nr:serine protease [Tuwongella immobilis]VIP02961.1 serine protease : Peptidase S1 and S6 chymotrypsin/Hap OS=Rhodopirellula europaea SH398 GN=RESH_02622 PE=4 SV=1: Trypsin_2 [Tuwongella immobilis]VTS02971.1 serine protease : Peptidase S1 and S6 chymotrypsin/Hap OS=Rhodopirellula europaea SH398 GN=RESH_02622 PE=4 SV=1: Trypsin_2 [Tuwongella immobilis]